MQRRKPPTSLRKSQKTQTLKPYVILFEAKLEEHLSALRQELLNGTYTPKPLTTFILRDPKTRKISKSDFRDRVIHHAIINIIEPLFDKTFIADNYANRRGKGTLKAIKRFEESKRKASKNLTKTCFVLKADVQHYFDTVDHDILIGILKKRINDNNVVRLIQIILENHKTAEKGKGMPLGNLTSQFFANVYLNELDQYVKHELKAKYYIRYVDDFIILHLSRSQLEEWQSMIDSFLRRKLLLERHPEKCRIIPLKQGVPFLGYRVFYHHKLLRRRNVRRIHERLQTLKEAARFGLIQNEYVENVLRGWNGYAQYANTHRLIMRLKERME